MGSQSQASLKIPLILVIIGMIGYLATSYYQQKQQFDVIRADLDTARSSLSENLNVLTQQTEQRFVKFNQLLEDFEAIQQRLSATEQTVQTEKTERNQLMIAQQEKLTTLKDGQEKFSSNLGQIDTQIKEIKEIQSQMIPTTLETRRLQQQIESLRQQLDSQSSRLSTLQEQISVRQSMGSETKSTNPLRAPMP